jgi:hypothetical protein
VNLLEAKSREEFKARSRNDSRMCRAFNCADGARVCVPISTAQSSSSKLQSALQVEESARGFEGLLRDSYMEEPCGNILGGGFRFLIGLTVIEAGSPAGIGLPCEVSMRLKSPMFGARPRAPRAARARRLHRLSVLCESLESRRLLSTAAPASSLAQLTAQPNLQVVPLVTTGPTGLSPQQIQAAYGVNSIAFSGGRLSGNGAGQTIAIVDAYNDPSITADLAAFDHQYGLQAPPSFTVKNLGASTTDPGWALETALDVEWAHALAPAANIVLVEASSASLGGLFSAVSAAASIPGVSVVSMSWGTSEFFGEWYYNNLFTTPANHMSITYVAASGDTGAWSGPSFPAVSPNVLAVGGTTLSLGSGNSYGSEAGWTYSTGGFSGLDSNFQYGLAEPSYQAAALSAAGLNYGLRTTPDVSFNADPNSGVAVYDSVSYSGQSGWFQVGGTSAAAPAWAGLVAITDQGLVAGGKGTLSTTQFLTDLYKLPSADFHDITSGFNGYDATPGYDLVTGLGTPKANLVVAGLLAANGIPSAPSAATSTLTVTVSTSSSASHNLVVQTSSSSSSSPASTTASGTIISPVATAGTSSTSNLALAPVAVSSSGAQGAPASSTTQAPAAAPVAQSTAAAPSLGQSLADQSTQARRDRARPSEPPSFLDVIESAQTGAPGSTDIATPESTPLPQSPVPSVPTPALQPLAPEIELEPLDLDQPRGPHLRHSPAGRSPSRPVESDEPRGSVASSQVATLAGVAAVVAGGYRLVLRESDWSRRRTLILQAGKMRRRAEWPRVP